MVDYDFIHTQEIERGMEEEGREGKKERKRIPLQTYAIHIFT